ncbi:MAG: SDR family oxidoreductase [Saprospiraceae bacterium]|nr:SDR family oxidoreductase [Saprospiraceae bacterium]
MKAVITGATKGIGRAITNIFFDNGFDVAICARTTADLEAFQTELKAKNANQEVMIQTVDMSKKAEVKAFAKAINEKWGAIDVLINNAGVFMPCNLADAANEDAFETMMDTNLYSAYYMTQVLLPKMIEQKSGDIFNICSIASIMPYGAYAVSKHAMLGFSRVLRDEVKDKGIRVCAVMPGATLTASWDGVEMPKERFMTPEDIANSVWSIYALSKHTVVEEIILRPQLGDI